MTIETIYQTVEDEITHLVKNKSLDITHLPELFKIPMELVEQGDKMNGIEKRDAVLNIITRVIETLVRNNLVPPLVGEPLIAAIKIIGPTIIGLICSAAKGLIEINKIVIQQCETKCGCCIN